MALCRNPLELRKDGQRVQLQDQPLQALDELLMHPGELVSRQRLIARLWPKRVVEYDVALNATMRRLRAVLLDDADKPRFIETIPRRGYRFIGQVTSAVAPFSAPGVTPDPTAPPDDRVRRWIMSWPAAVAVGFVAAAGWLALDRQPTKPAKTDAAASVEAARSIAVLPFADLSPEHNQQFLADGLAEDILILLAKIPELRVSARTSSFAFRDSTIDIAAIANKLHVTHVLEGSVRRADDRVRITVQLIDVGANGQAWSAVYDRTLSDIFALQMEIAGSIANALRVELGGDSSSIGTRNSVAYEAYLQGLHFFRRRASGDLERAQKHYAEAVEIDPQFAHAWSGLAGVYWIQTTNGSLAKEPGLEKLRHAAERALDLNPGLAEAHLRLRSYYWAKGDHATAHELLRSAEALEPGNALVMSFHVSEAVENGQIEAAVEWQRRIVAADPISVVSRQNLAEVLLLAGRLDEVIEQAARLQELDPGIQVPAAARAAILAGRYDEALNEVQSWPEGLDRSQCLAMIHHAIGRKEEASAALAALAAQAGATNAALIAEVYAFRGEVDLAYQWLERAVSQTRRNQTEPGKPIEWIRLSPFLAPLSADPRWRDWLASTQ